LFGGCDAVDQIRIRHKPGDGASARHRGAVRFAFHRRRGDGVRRREFLTLVSGTAVATWANRALAQQRAMPVVGFLADSTPEGFAPRVAAVKAGLADMGFVDNQKVTLEFRWARRNYDQLPMLADDLVRRRVSVIVTAGSEKVTRAAKDATTTIPIVATAAGDPVKRGLVKSINHP